MRNYFSTRFTYDKDRGPVWKAIAEYIRKTERTDDTVILELGAGYCFFINQVRCREKLALDMNPESEKYAAPEVTFMTGSSGEMARVPGGSVDIVFASNFFEHLDRPSLVQTFGGIKRVLRDSGRLILIQPNYKYCARDYFDDYTHLSVFSHVSMKDFLAFQGFTIEKCIPRFLPLTIKSKFPKKSFLVSLYLTLPYKIFAKQMYIVARKSGG